MASSRVSAHLPFYDSSKSSLAYGDRTIPKLNRELQSDDVRVRQQALLLLNDVIHRRENLAAALREGIAKTLQALLEDSDWLVRERTANALTIIAQHALGRQCFLELGMLTSLSKLFSDGEVKVRLSVHSALEMCARTTVGAQGVVDAGLVALCVEKLVQEDSTELKELLLATLHWCFMVSPTQGLECGAISSTVPLLTHPSPLVRGRTATLLHDLTTPYQGKEEACGHGVCVEGLVNLLSDRDSFVRAQTAAALMSISVITKGKYAVLEAGALPHLVALFTDPSSEVRTNAVKTVTMLAETPRGKQQLQSVVSQLEEMAGGGERGETETKTINTARTVITWTP
ncbi:Radial spoke head 14 homolog [Geodia barretti]|uniref:Radial spoke head 14 homolog n=2 Tax=Geodia barretti TaxID=519541 RepID=A0AA35RYW5_GEOBA|nr:Radial spoke head 14 homolog [Geodia barretti]